MTTTTLSDRPTELESADRLVLAVVDLGHPDVPAPAVLAAQALGRPITPVLLAPRVGSSTDAALVAGAHDRLARKARRFWRSSAGRFRT